jgi:hypothetical protein
MRILSVHDEFIRRANTIILFLIWWILNKTRKRVSHYWYHTLAMYSNRGYCTVKFVIRLPLHCHLEVSDHLGFIKFNAELVLMDTTNRSERAKWKPRLRWVVEASLKRNFRKNIRKVFMIAHHNSINWDILAEVNNESIILISSAFRQNQIFFFVSTKYSFWILYPSALPLYRGPTILRSEILSVRIDFFRLRKLISVYFGFTLWKKFRKNISHNLSCFIKHVFYQFQYICKQVEQKIYDVYQPLWKF